jgi:uridylate kinase
MQILQKRLDSNMNKDWIIISLGGSLLFKNDLHDDAYITAFVDLIKSKTGTKNFAVITGGGTLARKMQEELKIKNPSATPDELDWVGIEATRANAKIVRDAFGDIAEVDIFMDPHSPILTGKSVLVGGGFRPGHSSDGASVVLAQTLGAKKLINLSNIDYVYTADPRTNPDAIKIEESNWADFRKLLPEEWAPGINAPFDPVAAKMAEELGLEVAVMNGKNLENLSNYFDEREFVGTVIS